MWIEENYRRNLLDMHIDDWNSVFLSKINAEEYVEALKDAGIQAAMVKSMPHTGLCTYPSAYGPMHRGLHGTDYFGKMVELCHKNGISVIAYFSQVFDNYAYEKHPEWRTVTVDGKNHKDFSGQDCFRNGRYGIVCPNNVEYREYVKNHLTELNETYEFEAMFLDMTFWPDVCYCASCRKRYYEETGRELPRNMDWHAPEFREFQSRREQWLAEFAAFSTNCIKKIKPQVMVEHQFSMVMSPWIHASTELLMDAADYASGDYYGGYLQQSFINKYYRNISKQLPFAYHTSRCDPELNQHTTTKTEEQLLLHVITALVHDGAFLLVDAINPDGTIVPEVYHKLMKRVYSISAPYEKYVGGEEIADAAIWFSSFAKYDPAETGSVADKSFGPGYYQEAPVGMAQILRANNIPFTVVGSRNLSGLKTKLLILPHIFDVREEEINEIEKFLKNGGSVYVSGPIGHPRLAKLLGVELNEMEKTEQSFTYICPTEEGAEYLEGFTEQCPLSVPMAQFRVSCMASAAPRILATITYPYTMQDGPQFAAIHSNPPGIRSCFPAILENKVGAGTLLWTSAPIEMLRPYMSRQVVCRLMKHLLQCTGQKNWSFASNAPKFVEVLGWKKNGATFFAVLNEQEESPVAPMYELYIDLPYKITGAVLAGTETGLQTECRTDTDGTVLTRIFLPKLEIFLMIEVRR